LETFSHTAFCRANKESPLAKTPSKGSALADPTSSRHIACRSPGAMLCHSKYCKHQPIQNSIDQPEGDTDDKKQTESQAYRMGTLELEKPPDLWGHSPHDHLFLRHNCFHPFNIYKQIRPIFYYYNAVSQILP
jgi:hypothetical protein